MSDIKKDTPSQYITRSIKKYGIENFIFEIIDIANSKIELNDKEIFFINNYNSVKEGYNVTNGGDGGDTMSKHKDKNIIYKNRSKIYSGNKVHQYRHDLDKHIVEMIQLNSDGWSANDLSKKFNCSESTIRRKIPNYKKISSSNHHKSNECYQYRHDLDKNIK